jgi:hypothetical protein
MYGPGWDSSGHRFRIRLRTGDLTLPDVGELDSVRHRCLPFACHDRGPGGVSNSVTCRISSSRPKQFGSNRSRLHSAWQPRHVAARTSAAPGQLAQALTHASVDLPAEGVSLLGRQSTCRPGSERVQQRRSGAGHSRSSRSAPRRLAASHVGLARPAPT